VFYLDFNSIIASLTADFYLFIKRVYMSRIFVSVARGALSFLVGVFDV